MIKEGGADVEAVKMVSCLIQSITSLILFNTREELTMMSLFDDGVANIQMGSTPLHEAALKGHKAIVEYLIKEGGANVNAVDMVSRLIQSINHKSYSVQQREELTVD